MANSGYLKPFPGPGPGTLPAEMSAHLVLDMKQASNVIGGIFIWHKPTLIWVYQGGEERGISFCQ